MSIYTKLLNVQNKLKAPKGQYNSFGKYKYRNCEDILEAVKPHLYEENALVYLSDTIEMIGDRFYVKATATFVDCETKEKIEVFAYAREEESKKGMDGSQVTGASSSYARKYALNGLFDIDDTKDSDTTNNGETEAPVKKESPKKKEAPKKKPQGLSEDSMNLINQKLLEYKQVSGIAVKTILKAVEMELGFTVDSITDETQASKVVDFLTSCISQTKGMEVVS